MIGRGNRPLPSSPSPTTLAQGEGPTEADTLTASSRAPSMMGAFSIPAYRTLWFGTVLAFISFQAWGPAQSVVAYHLTGNNHAVGFVVFGQGLAMVLLNPLSGAVADRLSKRLVILVGQVLACATMITVGVLIRTGAINIPLLAIGAFLVGSMFSFNGPARNALIGDLVPRDKLGGAVAFMQVGANFSRTAAPFMAGALLAWPLVGLAGTYFLMASILFFVIITYLKIPDAPVRVKEIETSVLQDVRGGIRFVTSSPRLFHSVVNFYVVAVLGMSYPVLMPGFVHHALGFGAAGVGILLGASAAGGVITSLIVASKANSEQAQFYVKLSSFALGVALVLTGLAPTFLLAILAMALVGGGASAFQTLNNVVALRRSTPAFYGRVMALMFIAWGLNATAGLPIGLLADAWGERTVFAGLGISLCVATLLFAAWEARLNPNEPVS